MGQQHMRLDGILTLVDAKHITQHLEDEKPEGVENEAVEQIAFADRILLNKCDLVESEDELVEVERRIREINAKVSIKRTTNSEVEMDYVLGIRGFSLDKIIEMDDAFWKIVTIINMTIAFRQLELMWPARSCSRSSTTGSGGF